MGHVERNLDRAPAASLLAGAVGGAALGCCPPWSASPPSSSCPGRWGWPVFGLLVWIGVYEGYGIAARQGEELLALAGLSTRPLVRASPYGDRRRRRPASTPARSSTAACWRWPGPGSSGAAARAPLRARRAPGDRRRPGPARRRRGQRGLELLDALQDSPASRCTCSTTRCAEHEEVDAKLVALARRLGVGLLTVDANLQRVAELQGVHCLNLKAGRRACARSSCPARWSASRSPGRARSRARAWASSTTARWSWWATPPRSWARRSTCAITCNVADVGRAHAVRCRHRSDLGDRRRGRERHAVRRAQAVRATSAAGRVLDWAVEQPRAVCRRRRARRAPRPGR